MSKLEVLVLAHNRINATSAVIISTAYAILPLCEISITIVDNSSDEMSSGKIKKASSKAILLLGNDRVQYIRTPPDCSMGRNLYVGLACTRSCWAMIISNRTLINYEAMIALKKALDSEPVYDVGFLESTETVSYLKTGIEFFMLNGSISASSYAFNRGSIISGIVLRKANFPWHHLSLDSGIYNHVKPISLMALQKGIFSIASVRPISISSLDSLDTDGGHYNRPSCYGLVELINIALQIATISIFPDSTRLKSCKTFEGHLDRYTSQLPATLDPSFAAPILYNLLSSKASWATDVYKELVFNGRHEEADKFIGEISIACKQSPHRNTLQQIFATIIN